MRGGIDYEGDWAHGGSSQWGSRYRTEQEGLRLFECRSTVPRAPDSGVRISSGAPTESKTCFISILMKGVHQWDGITQGVTDSAVAAIPADSIAWPDRDGAAIQVGTEASDCIVGRREVGGARIRIRAVSRHAQFFG